MKKYLFSFISLICSLMISCASHGEKGDKLRLEHKWEEAAQEYKKGAENGDAYSMWRLAKAYGSGDGVELNDSIAYVWLKKAADANLDEALTDMLRAKLFGHYGVKIDTIGAIKMLDDIEKKTQNPYALSRIAAIYWDGIGDKRPSDKNKAVKILDKVTDKNEPYYWYFMGFVKCYGTDSIEINEAEAIEYWKKSHELGANAADKIGDLYLQGGADTQKDMDKAEEWYNKGVEANNTRAMVNLAILYANKGGDYENYENRKRVVPLLQKAIKHGDGDAADILGQYYSEGFIVEKDDNKAFEYFTQADKFGSINGTLNLSVMYFAGRGTSEDAKKGAQLLKKAAHRGSSQAAWYLYINSWESSGISKAEAIDYMKQAAKDNHPGACYNMAVMYYYGLDGFTQDYYQSFVYGKKAADGGNEEAYNLMAILYENGQGTNKNIEKANEYRNKIIH